MAKTWKRDPEDGRNRSKQDSKRQLRDWALRQKHWELSRPPSRDV